MNQIDFHALPSKSLPRLRYRLSGDHVSLSLLRLQREMIKAGFNPDQPRDNHGRWRSGGGSEGMPDYLVEIPKFQPAAYMGDYHDYVVNEVAKDLQSKGYTVVKEVRLILPGNPPTMARIDLMHRSPTGEVRALEIKTGFNPTFTPQQSIVYPHLAGGAGVVSPDYKISSLILTAGAPLPAIPVDFGWTRFPGDNIDYDNLRPELKYRQFWTELEHRS